MIQGKSIKLRVFKFDDLWNIITLFQNAELMRFYARLPTTSLSELEVEFREKLKNPDRLDLIVESRKEEVLGYAYLENISWKDRRAEMHIMMGSQQNNMVSYGVHASFLLLLFAFRSLNLHKVYAPAMAYASTIEKMVKNIGFKKEVTLKALYYQQGQYWDFNIFGILKKEFNNLLSSNKGQKYLKYFCN